MLRIVGRSEMGVNRLDAQVRTFRDRRQRPSQVVVPESQTVHPCVDLQVAKNATRGVRPGSDPFLAGGGGGEVFGGGRGGNRGRQVEFEDAVEIADAEGAEDQNGNADAGTAEDDALLDVGAGEHCRAGALEGQSDLARTVPIGVGFDDRDDARRGAPFALR